MSGPLGIGVAGCGATVDMFGPGLRLAADMAAAGELGELIEVEARWEWPQYFLGGY